MGSFLVSCNLTKQTIRDHEPVYIIPIVQQRRYTPITLEDGTTFNTHGSLVYNTDFYQPVGYMFEGTYNDYGLYFINWEQEANVKMLGNYFEYLQKYHYKVEEGSNSYHEKAVDFSEVNFNDSDPETIWEMIHEAIWQQRLLIPSNPYGKPTPVQVEYCVLHKEHADILLQMQHQQEIDSYTATHLPEVARVDKLSTKEKFEQVFYANLLEIAECEAAVANLNAQAPLTDEQDEERDKLISKLMDLKYPNSRSRKSHFFLGSQLGSSLSSHISTNEIQQTIDAISSVEQKEKAFTLFHHLYLLIRAMDMVNTYPSPVYYAGQDYGNVKGHIFAELLRRVQESNKQNLIDNSWADEIKTLEDAQKQIDLDVQQFTY